MGSLLFQSDKLFFVAIEPPSLSSWNGWKFSSSGPNMISGAACGDSALYKTSPKTKLRKNYKKKNRIKQIKHKFFKITLTFYSVETVGDEQSKAIKRSWVFATGPHLFNLKSEIWQTYRHKHFDLVHWNFTTKHRPVRERRKEGEEKGRAGAVTFMVWGKWLRR